MKKDRIVLREFAYFDRQKVEDLLSGIEDGLSREQKKITHGTDAEVKGKLGVPGVAEIEGGLGGKGIELQELKSSTDASLFQKLYTYLNESKLITSIVGVNKNLWDMIGIGDVLEIIGDIELSTMENAFDLLASIIPLIGQTDNVSTRKGIQLIELVKSLQTAVNIRILLKNKSYNFVASLPKNNIRVTKPELNSHYNILCRVHKKLNPGESYDLFSFIPGLKFPEDQLNQLIKTFPSEFANFMGKPIKMEDFRIVYPAIIVTPIAIYR